METDYKQSDIKTCDELHRKFGNPRLHIDMEDLFNLQTYNEVKPLQNKIDVITHNNAILPGVFYYLNYI